MSLIHYLILMLNLYILDANKLSLRIPITTKCYIQISSRLKTVEPTAIAWLQRSNRLIAGYSNGEICTFNGNTLECNEGKRLLNLSRNITKVLPIQSKNRILMSDEEGNLHVTSESIINQHKKTLHDQKEKIYDVITCPYEQNAIVGLKNAHPLIIDIDTLDTINVFKNLGFSTTTIDWHPRYNLIVAGSRSQEIQLWDSRHCDKIVFAGYLHKSNVYSVKWHPVNDYLFASLAANNVLCVWDIRKQGSQWQPMLTYNLTISTHKSVHNVNQNIPLDYETATANYIYDPTNDNLPTCLACFSNHNITNNSNDTHNDSVICFNWHPYHSNLILTGSNLGRISFWKDEKHITSVAHTVVSEANNDYKVQLNASINNMIYDKTGLTLITSTNHVPGHSGYLCLWKQPGRWSAINEMHNCLI